MRENRDDLIMRCNRRLDYDSAYFRQLDQYFHGKQPLSFIPEEVLALTGNRLKSLNVNLCKLIVDSVEERIGVEGFRLPENKELTDDLWTIWQKSDLDEFSQLAHREALIHGRVYVSVWGNADDPRTPRIEVESGRQMTVLRAPGSKKIVAALKRWIEIEGEPRAYATLFEADRITRLRSKAVIASDPYLTETQLLMTNAPGFEQYHFDFTQLPSTGWDVVEVIENPLGIVPVVEFRNDPRLLNWGTSELHDVLPLIDAIAKLASDLMVSAEFHATPRRWASGIEIQEDELGNPIDSFSTLRGKTWLAESDLVKFGQFDEADLSNFANAITLLVRQIAAISGLPPHYLQLSSEPASADAIRSSEASLVSKARRKQRHWGESWEQVMKLALLVRDGKLPQDVERLEAIFKSPETRTWAQQVDAAAKLRGIGFPVSVLAEDLGYSPQQIERIIAAMEKEAALVPLAPDTTAAPIPVAPETQREERFAEDGR